MLLFSAAALLLYCTAVLPLASVAFSIVLRSTMHHNVAMCVPHG